LLCDAPKREEIARAIVVELDVSVTYQARPRVDEETGRKRLKIGAILGRVAIGGALAAANIALGVVAGIITSFPAVTGHVEAALAVTGSTFLGIHDALGGVKDLAAVLEKKELSL
jgi:hypothetical protein